MRRPDLVPVRTFVLSIDRPVDQLRLLFEDLILDGAPTSLVNADLWTSNGVLTLVNPNWQAGASWAAGTPLLRITTVDEMGADAVADAVDYGLDRFGVPDTVAELQQVPYRLAGYIFPPAAAAAAAAPPLPPGRRCRGGRRRRRRRWSSR